jgi:hypothetical protein
VRIDGNFSSFLFVVNVEKAGAVVDAAAAVDQFAVMKESVEQGRLTDRTMPDKRNVSDVFDVVFAHVPNPPFWKGPRRQPRSESC